MEQIIPVGNGESVLIADHEDGLLLRIGNAARQVYVAERRLAEGRAHLQALLAEAGQRERALATFAGEVESDAVADTGDLKLLNEVGERNWAVLRRLALPMKAQPAGQDTGGQPVEIPRPRFPVVVLIGNRLVHGDDLAELNWELRPHGYQLGSLSSVSVSGTEVTQTGNSPTMVPSRST